MRLNKALAFSCMSLTLACAGAAQADTFSTGQFITFDQGDWGNSGSADSLLAAHFNTVFASTNDVLTVGVAQTPGQNSIAFTDPGSIQAYMPPSGTPEALTTSLTNPTSTSSGVFGGDVVALDLNIAFSNAGLLGASKVPFGGLVLTDMGAFNLSSLNGVTVTQFLADANACLGGGACPLTDRPELNFTPLDFTDALTQDLDASFEGGTVSMFADDHLALPSSTTAPEPSSLLLLAPGLAGLAFLRRPRILRE